MRGYLICTSPRSGSTALCSLLTSSGVLGQPIEDFNSRYLDNRAPPDGRFETFLRDGMLARGGRSQVIATKIFWFQLEKAVRRLAPELTPRQGFERLLECTDPRPIVIRLERREKLRQAVSYARAAKSNIWRLPHGADNPPCDLDESDFESVDRWVAKFEWWQVAWDVLCEALAVSPMRLWYEDLIEDWFCVLDQIAAKLDINLPLALRSRVTIDTARQSDAATEEFLKMFRSWKSLRLEHGECAGCTSAGPKYLTEMPGRSGLARLPDHQ